MKLAGTIKLEIVKPLDVSWKTFRKRAKAMSRALAPALTLTMRKFYPAAVDELDARWHGERADASWKFQVRTALHERWNSELARMLGTDRKFATKNKQEEPDAASYLPVLSIHANETVDHILSRFAGDHLKDLLASRSSFPSFVGETAFYCEGRPCVVEGSPDNAVLRFPLWGTGKKLTSLVVAPCGGHARVLWRKLVADFSRRDEVVALERALKAVRAEKAPGEDKAELTSEQRAEKVRLTTQLEELGLLKLGRIGMKYDSKKNKWYALISWSQMRPDNYKQGQTAAVNLGVNVFLQALNEEGMTWDCPGSDVRVTRERFAARRRSIQRALNFRGRGARGHGKKRAFQAVTKLDKKEHDWMQTKNRTIAAQFVKWCTDQGVSDVLLEDLAGIRDSFEKKTEGAADVRVKRAIHSWAFHELGLAIERQCEEKGLRVTRVSSADCSQRCPDCGHAEPENVELVDRGGDYLLHPAPDPRDPEKSKRAKVYRSVDKGTRFLCKAKACGHKGKGDMVTCANMLVNAGKVNPLGKAQERAKKRVSGRVKQAVAGKGEAE